MSPQKELKCFFNVSEFAFFLMLITQIVHLPVFVHKKAPCVLQSCYRVVLRRRVCCREALVGLNLIWPSWSCPKRRNYGLRYTCSVYTTLTSLHKSKYTRRRKEVLWNRYRRWMVVQMWRGRASSRGQVRQRKASVIVWHLMTSYPARRLPVDIPVCDDTAGMNGILFSLCVCQGVKRLDPALYSNYTNK